VGRGGIVISNGKCHYNSNSFVAAAEQVCLQPVHEHRHCMYDDFVALYLGIKMFIIEYLYNRFPRFKQHHDTVYKIWQQLPTDAILEDQYKRSLVDRVCLSFVLRQRRK